MLMRAALFAVAAMAVAAPSNRDGRESSHLPVEHRQEVSTTANPVEEIVEAVLTSETLTAVDEAAARITSAVGDVVDDLGDFVVDTVKDLPQTIREVSDRVSQAVSDGSERVVIVVKGVRKQVSNQTANAGKTVTNTVDRVFDVANSSQTASSFKDLQERIAITTSRIFSSFLFNLDKIDRAVADGIRRMSGEGSNSNNTTTTTTTPVPVRPSGENEIRALA